MKQIIIIILFIFCWIGTAFAQKAKTRFELGLNYPIALDKDRKEENHIGIYFNGIYKFADNPFSLNLKLSYESYTAAPKNYIINNGRSLSLIPAFNYYFTPRKAVEIYAGFGTGISIDNTNSGVFNDGYATHFAAVPKVGILLVRHININLQYYATHKDFSRFMAGVGYVF